MELRAYRDQMDEIDRELLALFQKRMELSAQIGAYKKAHNLPIYQPQRETEKLRALTENAPQELKEYVDPLYAMLFRLSRSYQDKLWENGLPCEDGSKDRGEGTSTGESPSLSGEASL
ncbi:MAG: chorismate mutase [Oscillospiraceae bacterium]|nr:chorismate mutase [Oscillospiraceae bacterium]